MSTASNQTELLNWDGTSNLTITQNIVITGSFTQSVIYEDCIIDGQEFTITVDGTIATFHGIFIIDSTATATIEIKDINLSLSTAIGGGGGGILGTMISNVEGNNSITISECSVVGSYDIGGNSGTITGGYTKNCTITKCYSTGTISGSNSGGICGVSVASSVSITNCYSSGDITGSKAGGIGGKNCSANITNCYSTGTIMAHQSGGIVGRDYYGDLYNCYSTGNIDYVGTGGCGGIAGNNCFSNIYNCYSYGTINSGGTGNVGIAYKFANNSAIMTNCYARGATSTGSGQLGLYYSGNPGTLSNNGFGSGTWTDPIGNGYLVNSISNYTDIWSDTNSVTPPVINAPFILTSFLSSPFSHTTYDSNEGFLSPSCIIEGSYIMTNKGNVLIEDLSVGTLIKTHNNEFRKLTHIGSDYTNKSEVRVIKAGVLNNDKDLYLTNDHSLLFENVLDKYKNDKYQTIKRVPIGKFYKIKMNETTLSEPSTINKKYKYYNLVVESDDGLEPGIYANDILVESCYLEWFILNF